MTGSNPDIPITAAAPEDAVRAWFALLGKFCAAIDYDAAEAIFAPEVVSFGTRADIVTGLDNLRRTADAGSIRSGDAVDAKEIGSHRHPIDDLLELVPAKRLDLQ